MDVVSYRGTNINDGSTYVAWVVDVMGMPVSEGLFVRRLGRRPVLSGKELPPKRFTVEIHIVSSAGSLVADRAALKRLFDTDDESSGQFVIQDFGGGRQRYVNATCEAFQHGKGGTGRVFVATMAVDGDVRWRKTTTTTDTWNITASGQTKTVANDGEDDAYPILKVKPTSAKTGSSPYRRWVAVRWRVDTAFSQYPVDIVNAGLDTRIASTNFALANGDDLRVIVDGVEVDRWLHGEDTATTKVWVNLDFQAKAESTLEANIGSGDAVDTIDVTGSITGFPASGILLINNEAFTYTGKNNSLKRFTGVTRAAKGTTAANHTAGDTVIWIQHDIWITYGDASASAPSIDDDYVTAFDYTGSTNTSWDYEEFGSDDGLRPMSWKFTNLSGPGEFADAYTGDRGADADPWDAVGMQVSDQGKVRVHVHNPCGITNANFYGGSEQYAEILADWQGSIDSSKDGATWRDEYLIPAPSSAGTWETWSRSQALTAGSKYAGLYLEDKAGTGDSLYLDAEFVTLTLDSTKTPTVSVGSEQGNYALAATITNNTTGDAVSLEFTMSLNEELELDTDEKTVIYLADDSGQFQAVTVEGGARKDWLPLEPGNNELQYDDVGTNGVTIAIEFEERHF